MPGGLSSRTTFRKAQISENIKKIRAYRKMMIASTSRIMSRIFATGPVNEIEMPREVKIAAEERRRMSQGIIFNQATDFMLANAFSEVSRIFGDCWLLIAVWIEWIKLAVVHA